MGAGTVAELTCGTVGVTSSLVRSGSERSTATAATPMIPTTTTTAAATSVSRRRPANSRAVRLAERLRISSTVIGGCLPSRSSASARTCSSIIKVSPPNLHANAPSHDQRGFGPCSWRHRGDRRPPTSTTRSRATRAPPRVHDPAGSPATLRAPVRTKDPGPRQAAGTRPLDEADDVAGDTHSARRRTGSRPGSACPTRGPNAPMRTPVTQRPPRGLRQHPGQRSAPAAVDAHVTRRTPRTYRRARLPAHRFVDPTAPRQLKASKRLFVRHTTCAYHPNLPRSFVPRLDDNAFAVRKDDVRPAVSGCRRAEREHQTRRRGHPARQSERLLIPLLRCRRPDLWLKLAAAGPKRRHGAVLLVTTRDTQLERVDFPSHSRGRARAHVGGEERGSRTTRQRWSSASRLNVRDRDLVEWIGETRAVLATLLLDVCASEPPARGERGVSQRVMTGS